MFFSKCAKFLVGFKNSGCVSVFGTFCLVDFTLDYVRLDVAHLSEPV